MILKDPYPYQWNRVRPEHMLETELEIPAVSKSGEMSTPPPMWSTPRIVRQYVWWPAIVVLVVFLIPPALYTLSLAYVFLGKLFVDALK